jgi:hypothetical protein
MEIATLITLIGAWFANGIVLGVIIVLAANERAARNN